MASRRNCPLPNTVRSIRSHTRGSASTPSSTTSTRFRRSTGHPTWCCGSGMSMGRGKAPGEKPVFCERMLEGIRPGICGDGSKVRD
jgi:hypothetical protein